jgi:DNA adenine methylase
MIEKQLSLFGFEENDIILKKSTPLKKVFIDKVSPPIRYPGSKFRASKYILPYLETSHTEYREPFMGSGAIFFTKQKVENNWMNDIDYELIVTFKVIQDDNLRNLMIEKVNKFIPSKEAFIELKKTKFENEIDIAYRYFVINRTAYSGIMKQPNWGFHPIKSVQPDKWGDRIISSSIKLKNVQLTNLDYQTVINKKSNNEVLLFVDPPYFLADQKRAYLHSFTLNDHINLCKILKDTNHKFCLTYDNCPKIKEMYSWANIHEYNWMYHTANSNNTSRKMGKELIITNY